MTEENLEDNSSAEKNIHSDIKKSKVPESMKIVGFNLLVLAFYTVACKLSNDVGGIIIDAFIIGIHVIVCIITAIARQSWIWLLSALVILIVGFSTCISFGNMKI